MRVSKRAPAMNTAPRFETTERGVLVTYLPLRFDPKGWWKSVYKYPATVFIGNDGLRIRGINKSALYSLVRKDNRTYFVKLEETEHNTFAQVL